MRPILCVAQPSSSKLSKPFFSFFFFFSAGATQSFFESDPTATALRLVDFVNGAAVEELLLEAVAEAGVVSLTEAAGLRSMGGRPLTVKSQS